MRGSRRALGRAGEPEPETVRPTAPEWLSVEAKAAFDLIVEHLSCIGLVTAIDGNALVRYARLWLRWRQCEQFLEKNGEVYPVRAKPSYNGQPGAVLSFKAFPQAKLALTLAAELLRLEREFGMTPAARARLASGVDVQDDVPTFDYFGPPDDAAATG
jgi:P27 family predicted phage terminase small subunit